MLVRFLHGNAKPGINRIIMDICECLRSSSCNWKTLTTKFRRVEFDDSVVERVLVELKERTDAKRALSFFHWSAQLRTVAHGLQSYSLMIHILIRSNLVADAKALVEAILEKTTNPCSQFLVADSIISSYESGRSSSLIFDLLVQAYAKLRRCEAAFDVCRYLGSHGFSVSLSSFNSLIHVVRRCNSMALLWKIYEHMVRIRVYPNQATIRTMIDALCKEGKVKIFVNLLDKIDSRRRFPALVIVNTCLVWIVFEEGRIQDGTSLLKTMLRKNMVVDNIAYSLLIHGAAKVGNMDSALKLFDEMHRRCFPGNSFVYASLIDAYCREGRTELAKEMMSEMENLGFEACGETFDSLITAFARSGRLNESSNYLDKMVERGLLPCVQAFNNMVANMAGTWDVKRASTTLTHLIDRGFAPDETSYAYLIALVCHRKEEQEETETEEVLKLYYEMQHRSQSPGPSVMASVITCLCNSRKVEEAENFLLQIQKHSSSIPKQDVYEALIRAHLRNSDKPSSRRIYKEMLSFGLEPCAELMNDMLEP